MTTPYPPYLPNPQYIDSQFNESNYYDNESIVHHRIYYTFLCALFVVDVETPHHIYSSPAGWRIITSRPSPQSDLWISLHPQSAITVTIILVLSVGTQSSGIIRVISPMDHACLLPVRWLAKGNYNTDKLSQILL